MELVFSFCHHGSLGSVDLFVLEVISLYLNVFVLVVQVFQKTPFPKAIASTQSEPPFLLTQFAVLALFVALTTTAAIRFRNVSVQRGSLQRWESRSSSTPHGRPVLQKRLKQLGILGCMHTRPLADARGTRNGRLRSRPRLEGSADSARRAPSCPNIPLPSIPGRLVIPF